MDNSTQIILLLSIGFSCTCIQVTGEIKENEKEGDRKGEKWRRERAGRERGERITERNISIYWFQIKTHFLILRPDFQNKFLQIKTICNNPDLTFSFHPMSLFIHLSRPRAVPIYTHRYCIQLPSQGFHLLSFSL